MPAERKSRPGFGYAPAFERCIVIPDKHSADEKVTKAGIILKLDVMDIHPAMEGKLIAAGLGAFDWMRHHGIKLGDHVLYSKNAGVGHQWVDEDGTSFTFLILNARDLLCSAELAERYASGEMTIETEINADGKEVHVIVEKAIPKGKRTVVTPAFNRKAA